MKKLYILLLVVFICAVLAGCAGKVDECEIAQRLTNEDDMFVVIYEGLNGIVFVDKDTGVMYFYRTRCITPLYNADGSLRIWEGLSDQTIGIDRYSIVATPKRDYPVDLESEDWFTVFIGTRSECIDEIRFLVMDHPDWMFQIRDIRK